MRTCRFESGFGHQLMNGLHCLDGMGPFFFVRDPLSLEWKDCSEGENGEAEAFFG